MAQPIQIGFSCKDDSIRYPLKSNPLTSIITVTITSLLPLLVINLIELRRCRSKNMNATATTVDNPMFKSFGAALWSNVSSFLFGYLCVMFITLVTKFMVGRQRPYFVAACSPDWSKINCSTTYIWDVPCTNPNRHLVREAQLSFPSGHSSLAWYAAIYLVVYLQVRWSRRRSRFPLALLQVLFLALAILTACSRVALHQHHVGDVVAGSILGSVGALLTLWSVSDLELPSPQQRDKVQVLYAPQEEGNDQEITTHTVPTPPPNKARYVNEVDDE